MRILCFAGYANSGEKDAQYIGEGTAIVLFPGEPRRGGCSLLAQLKDKQTRR